MFFPDNNPVFSLVKAVHGEVGMTTPIRELLAEVIDQSNYFMVNNVSMVTLAACTKNINALQD